ncbi:membrane integrity-associated transporter subunit PqiC [Castellaniella sp.]|uniref:PqiC family protein n=1 Tax=Castellaniella sp. TaxID=1955812 RepID=UPI003566F31E
MPIWPILLFLCVLSACATAPTRYYSLIPVQDAESPRAPAMPANGSAAADPLAPHGLRLDVVEVPAQVDRLQLVVRDPRHDPAGEVQVLNESLWSASLDSQLQAVLSARVSMGLGLVDLQRLPMASGRPARSIEVRLTRFDLVWGEFSRLAAIWVDQAPGSEAPRICEADIQVPAGGSVPDLVQSQRDAARLLSELITEAATGLTTGLQGSYQVSKFGCT